MRDAMLAATTLNTFNNHADRVKMANIAQAVNVLQAVVLTNEEKIILTPTYHVMRMFNVHQDAQLIPTDFVSPQYIHGNKVLPAISVSASIDATTQVHFSIVNIDSKKSHKVEIDITDLSIESLKGEILQSAQIQDHNTFEQPQLVSPKAFSGAKIDGDKIILEVPPFSVIVLEGNK